MITTSSMGNNIGISSCIKKSVDLYLENDPCAKQIAEVEETLSKKKDEVIDLESKLFSLQKKRPEINIEYRNSIIWCLEVDSDNPYYFLKSKESLVKCAEFKHKIKLTPKQNNTFGSILSGMFKDNRIGRIEHMNMFFYGLPSLFKVDKNKQFTILKKEYQDKVSQLRQVSI